MPQISVLMPVWNGCRGGSNVFLQKAIESILDQTFKDFEFIIVDDGSTDATPSILQRYATNDSRIKVFTLLQNKGIVTALNHGLSNCTAELIARQDADDMSTVTRLEIQKNFMEARPGTILCGTGMYVINEEGKLVMEIRHPCNPQIVRRSLANGCVFVHGSVMYRKNAILAAGGYSTNPLVQHAEDYDLWVRLAANKDNVLENIPDRSLYFHRNHGSKISSIHSAQQTRATSYIQQMARSLGL